MNKNSFLFTSTIFKVVIIGFFFIGCTPSNTEPTQTLSPNSPSSTFLPSPSPVSITPFPEIVLPTATSTQEIISQSPPTQTPTQGSTLIPTLTLTPVISPELLIAAVEVKNKGEANETKEVWIIDTLTQGKKWVFTAIPGTRILELMWAENQTDILYITEVTGGDADEPVNWQFYEVNYQIGEVHPLFSERVAGLPDLIDLSFGGKWLCVFVNYFDSLSFEWWFINTENGDIIKNLPQERYLNDFTWSPNEPDTFAYYQGIAQDGNEIIPQKIVISRLPDFEILETLEYDETWTNSVVLSWGISNPEQILFFSLGRIYQIGLSSKQWIQVAQGLNIPPDNQIFQSFSGQWAATTRPIYIVSLNVSPQIFDDFKRSNQNNIFFSWYNQENWGIIITQSAVQIYDMEHKFTLLKEVKLSEYGFIALNPYATIAKPRD